MAYAAFASSAMLLPPLSCGSLGSRGLAAATGGAFSGARDATLQRCRKSRNGATLAADADIGVQGSDLDLGRSQAKQRLLHTVAGTHRGGEAGSLKRGEVEEAQVAVESFAGSYPKWDLLEGTWSVVYTTAADVLPLVRPGLGLPGLPLRALRVAQRFSSPAEGRVQNIIDVEALGPLVSGSTARLVVEASYEVRTARSIALTFRAAAVEQVWWSDGLQNLLAPALLPRGWWNQQLLMALEAFTVRIPLPNQLRSLDSSAKQPVGINYALSYLDEDMLIGRAQGSGGTFIFVRDA